MAKGEVTYMTKEIPVSRLVNSFMPALSELGSVPMSGAVANAIRKNARQLEIAFAEWNHEQNKILKDYAELDEGGKPIVVTSEKGERKVKFKTPEGEAEYNKRWEDEFAKSISVMIAVVPSRLLDNINGVKPVLLAAIQYMIEEDVVPSSK